MIYYFYILRCFDNTLYSGWTTDLKRRVYEHNGNDQRSAKYTRGRRPLILEYFEIYSTKHDVMKREVEIKRWTKKKKEKIIELFKKTNNIKHNI